MAAVILFCLVCVMVGSAGVFWATVGVLGGLVVLFEDS